MLNIHFAMGGAIFGDFTAESVRLIAKYGLPGVEPYRGHLTAWLNKPQALKDLLDAQERHWVASVGRATGIKEAVALEAKSEGDVARGTATSSATLSACRSSSTSADWCATACVKRPRQS